MWRAMLRDLLITCRNRAGPSGPVEMSAKSWAVGAIRRAASQELVEQRPAVGVSSLFCLSSAMCAVGYARSLGLREQLPQIRSSTAGCEALTFSALVQGLGAPHSRYGLTFDSRFAILRGALELA